MPELSSLVPNSPPNISPALLMIPSELLMIRLVPSKMRTPLSSMVMVPELVMGPERVTVNPEGMVLSSASSGAVSSPHVAGLFQSPS